MGNVLPVTCRHVGSDSGFRKPFRLVIERPEDELMASLPFEDAPGFGYLNMEVFPKEGSTLLATASLPQSNPATVVMGVGGGRSVAFPPYITDPNPVVVPFAGWKYYIDFLPNLMIYTAQAPLPSDYLMMHRLRRKLGDYSDLRGLAVGVLSFAEGLGANTLAARKKIEVADGQLAEARDLFIKKDIAAAERSLDRAMETLKDAKSTAMKEKDRAFLWIYAIEYLAVTATLMISGALLWELMVRRIMYRETRITRSA